MKRFNAIVVAFFMIFTLGFSNIANASADAEVKFEIKGEVKQGENIEIVVDFKNIKNLYAASVVYTYDNTLLKINDIVPSEDANNNDTLKAFKDTALNGNKVRYGFTYLGPKQMGLSKDCNFVVIKAEVLKDGEIDLSTSNIKMQLVQKSNNDMVDIGYKLNLPGKEVVDVPPSKWGEADNEDTNGGQGGSDEDKGDTNKDTLVEGEDEGEANSTGNEDSSKSSDKKNKDSAEISETEDKNNATIYIILSIIALAAVGYGAYVTIKKRRD